MSRIKNKSENGRLVVELVLIIPFLVTLFLVSSEMSKYARNKQAVSVLVGEVGEAVYRSCSSFWELDNGGNNFNLANTQERTRLCLDDVVDRVGFAQLNENIRPFLRTEYLDVDVSIFALIPGNSVQLLGTRSIFSPNTPSANRPTRFSEAGGGISGPIPISNAMITQRQRVVVVEGHFRFNGLFSQVFGFDSLPNGEVYDAAVF